MADGSAIEKRGWIQLSLADADFTSLRRTS